MRFRVSTQKNHRNSMLWGKIDADFVFCRVRADTVWRTESGNLCQTQYPVYPDSGHTFCTSPYKLSSSLKIIPVERSKSLGNLQVFPVPFYFFLIKRAAWDLSTENLKNKEMRLVSTKNKRNNMFKNDMSWYHLLRVWLLEV